MIVHDLEQLDVQKRGGLLKELPKGGEIWSGEKRKLWLDTAASIFKMIYKDAPAKGLRRYEVKVPRMKEAAN